MIPNANDPLGEPKRSLLKRGDGLSDPDSRTSDRASRPEVNRQTAPAQGRRHPLYDTASRQDALPRDRKPSRLTDTVSYERIPTQKARPWMTKTKLSQDQKAPLAGDEAPRCDSCGKRSDDLAYSNVLGLGWRCERIAPCRTRRNKRLSKAGS